MKRLMPSSLITFLQTHKSCHRADCFVISLPNGQTLYATSGQWDITFKSGTPGWTGAQTTFKASQYGRWSRGKIVSEAGFKCAANTMPLTCIPQVNTLFPGLGMTIHTAALDHLFEGATVNVYTAYMPIGGYGDVSAGIETKWMGQITRQTKVAPNAIGFDCADPMYFLNMKVPARLLQANCPWKFTDVNCTLSAADYIVAFTAKTGSTQSNLIPLAAFTQADDYFAKGVVTCTTGANAGLSQTVKLHKSGSLTLMVPWLLPVVPGDTFSVIKGCDLTLAMCKATVRANGTVVDNSANFGGTPFVPVPSTFV